MRVQIMGAGALGCLFGYLIQRAGYEVIFVSRGKQLEALRRGLRISGLLEDEVKIYATDKPQDADVTFVTVKAYDTETVAKALSNVDCGVVCSLQNGIGNEEILMKYLSRVLGGVTTYASNLLDYGHIVYAGKGETFVGRLDGVMDEDVRMVVKVLCDSGIDAKAVEDIRRRIWLKAVINSAINPITAICRCKNGKIVEIPELWNLAEEVAKEGEKVMRALGFDVPDLAELVRKVAISTKDNRSSMLQDIERGKRTEIDFINGAIVRVAKELGIETPYNKALHLLVKGVERLEMG